MAKKVISLISISFVIALGIIIISISFNFVDYKNYQNKQNEILKQLVFINNDHNFEGYYKDLERYEYVDKRVAFPSEYYSISCDDYILSDMKFPLTYFYTIDNEFLLLKEKDICNIIGKNTTNKDEVIVTYKFCEFIMMTKNIGSLDLLEKNIVFFDSTKNEEISFKIVGIIDKETCEKINYLNNIYIFTYNEKIDEKNISLLTYEYNDIDLMERLFNKYKKNDLVIYQNIDQLKKNNTYLNILTITFLFLGIITIITSFGISQNIVNMSFYESLSFLSMLKIIGIKEKKISLFLVIESILLMIGGLVLSIPIGIIFYYLLNYFIDGSKIFIGININILDINYFSIILTIIIDLFLCIFSLALQIKKVKLININDISLNELEGK